MIQSFRLLALLGFVAAFFAGAAQLQTRKTLEQAIEEALSIDLTVYSRDDEFQVGITGEGGMTLCEGTMSRTRGADISCSYDRGLMKPGENTIFVTVFSKKKNCVVLQTTNKFIYDRFTDSANPIIRTVSRNPTASAGALAAGGAGYLWYEKMKPTSVKVGKQNRPKVPPRPRPQPPKATQAKIQPKPLPKPSVAPKVTPKPVVKSTPVLKKNTVTPAPFVFPSFKPTQKKVKTKPNYTFLKTAGVLAGLLFAQQGLSTAVKQSPKKKDEGSTVTFHFPKPQAKKGGLSEKLEKTIGSLREKYNGNAGLSTRLLTSGLILLAQAAFVVLRKGNAGPTRFAPFQK